VAVNQPGQDEFAVTVEFDVGAMARLDLGRFAHGGDAVVIDRYSAVTYDFPPSVHRHHRAVS